MASDIPLIVPEKDSAPGDSFRGHGRGYSATVEMELHVDNRVLFPSHAAGDFVIFDEPQTLTLSSARLIISVDGVSQESTIDILPHESPARRIPVRIVKPT